MLRRTTHRIFSMGVLAAVLAGAVGTPAAAGYRALASIPAGHDFNNDGYDDLAIGIPGATVNGHAGAGAVEVLYGSSTGLRAKHSQLWTLDSTGIPGTSAKGDKLGFAVASGDFNSDGYDDLAMGAPGRVFVNNGVKYRNSGEVFVLFGSAQGLRPRSGHVRLVPRCPRCEYGYSLATGDVMTGTGFDGGDGYADLVIGAPGENQLAIDSGRYLSSLGGAGEVGMGPIIKASAQFGTSVAVGRFFGLSDWAVVGGAPGADANSTSGPVAEAGVAWIFRHGGSPVVLQQDALGGNPAEAGDHFGASVAAADLDGNGYDDLLAGVPGEAVVSLTDSGGVEVMFSQAGGGFGSGSTSYTLTLDSPNVPGDRATGDLFGASVTTADVSGNGTPDIIVGAPGKRLGTQSGAGAVAVVMNLGTGMPASGGNQLWSQNSSGVPDTAEAGDHFGASLGVGQFGKGPGVDLAIGVPLEDVGGHPDAGGVIVLYGTPMIFDSSGSQFWTRDSAGISGAADAKDHFGQGLP